MWKDKTCENCMYRVDTTCRKFPPNVLNNMDVYPDCFPCVYVSTIYSKACSCYEETK